MSQNAHPPVKAIFFSCGTAVSAVSSFRSTGVTTHEGLCSQISGATACLQAVLGDIILPKVEPERDNSVSVVVPTYMEADNIPLLVSRLDEVRTKHNLNLELILVDDDSGDGTETAVAQLAEPWVRLIVRSGRRGLASAVAEGLAAAAGDVLVVMDADLQHPPEKIPEMLDAIAAGADFVIASRYAKGGKTEKGWGALRRFNSWVATLLARPLAPAKISDPMSGFFALPRSTYARADELNPIGYKIGLELLAKCNCRNVREVPITFARRRCGRSKLSGLEQLRFIRHLGRLWKYKRGKNS